MLNENAKKWVAALRSGKYEQGKYHLCKDDKYCCLGVATQLYIDEKDATYPHKPPMGGTLTTPVKKWLGLRTIVGGYSIKNNSGSLAYLNDVKQNSFQEIADFIESEPEGLFVKEEEANAE